MNKIKDNEVILHGEAMIIPIKKIPSSAKKIQPTNDDYHIIANSETVGNHHVVKNNDTIQFFMGEDGTMYMQNDNPTSVECIHAERHNEITIPSGNYEFGIQKEYDHFAQNHKNVMD